MMNFHFLSKWSIIILSINLLSIQVSSVNSRSNETLQTEILQVELDFDNDVDDEAQQIDATNDYEDTTHVIKELSSLRNKEKKSAHLPFYSQKQNGGIVKHAADLELAEFELEKVEKNVEKELINLKKRYNDKEDNRKREINRNHENPSVPRLMKIRVETYEIDNEPVGDQSNSNGRRDRSSLMMTNMTAPLTIEKTTTYQTDIVKKNETRILIENAIQKKIDAIKNKVKRLVAKEQKHNNSRRNNASFNELRKVNNIDIRSFYPHELYTSPENTASNLKKISMKRRSALKNQQQKLIAKKIGNHHDAKKMIRKSKKTPVISRKVSSVDLDTQLQSTLLKSKGSGSQRFSRRLRKPPDDSLQLFRSSRRLKKPHHLEKYYQSSRKLRKSPESKITLPEEVQTNRKNRHVTNAQNIMTNSNFLFHEKFHHKEPAIRSDQVRQFSPPKRKLEGRSKHRYEKKKRAMGAQFNPTNSDRAVEFMSPHMVNSLDINSQLVSEYSDTFGGFPSDSDDMSLLRYKRVKRS